RVLVVDTPGIRNLEVRPRAVAPVLDVLVAGPGARGEGHRRRCDQCAGAEPCSAGTQPQTTHITHEYRSDPGPTESHSGTPPLTGIGAARTEIRGSGAKRSALGADLHAGRT